MKGAFEGMRVAIDKLQHELQALEQFGRNARDVLCGVQLSPIEPPFAAWNDRSPFLKAVDRLRESVLTDPAFNDRYMPETPRRLDMIEELAERALGHFDRLRLPYCRFEPGSLEIQSMGNLAGRLPADVHELARSTYFELMDTSRFSLEDPPSIYAMSTEGIGTLLDDDHKAAIAALACLAHAIRELEDLLSHWRDECAACWPAMHFDARPAHPLLVPRIAVIREEAHARAREVEALQEADRWIERSAGWLAHWAHMEAAEAREESAVQRATQVAAIEASKMATARKREAARRKGIDDARKAPLLENTERVKAAWKRRTTEERGRGVIKAIAAELALSEPTVRKILNSSGDREPRRKIHK